MTRIIILALTALCSAGFLLTLDMVFYGTPIDRLLFFSQKIFYYHVPCSFVLFAAVIVCGIYSILYMRSRDGRHDDVALAAGELAIVFGGAMMVTGSIWGKAAWGVWWQWDARLTTALLLWMVMIGYMLVRKYGGPGSERLSAGLAIFGMVNVPLVYGSVRFWRTLHPETSVVPSLEGSMRLAFWLSVALFLAFFAVLLVGRVGQGRLLRRVHEAREKALDAGILE